MFAQLVIGPPGSGKTTYCSRAREFLGAIGRRAEIINLDPAVSGQSISITDLISLDEIMKDGLGPNGGIIHALELLAHNVEWLEDKIAGEYLIIDCPGQVELFTHIDALKVVIRKLEKMGYRITVVHLVDAHHCSEPAKYISVLLLTLRTMLQLDLPHVTSSPKSTRSREI